MIKMSFGFEEKNLLVIKRRPSLVEVCWIQTGREREIPTCTPIFAVIARILGQLHCKQAKWPVKRNHINEYNSL